MSENPSGPQHSPEDRPGIPPPAGSPWDSRPPGGEPPQGPYPPQGGEPPQGPYPPQGGEPPRGTYPPQPSYPPQGGSPAYGYEPRPSGYPQPGTPPPPDYGPHGYGHAYAPAPSEPSALGGLTDLGFTRRITPGLAKVVYVVVLVLAVLGTFIGVIGAIGAFSTAGNQFIGGGGWVFNGLVLLIGAPLGSFVVVAFARFWLEYFLDRAAAARR